MTYVEDLITCRSVGRVGFGPSGIKLCMHSSKDQIVPDGVITPWYLVFEPYHKWRPQKGVR